MQLDRIPKALLVVAIVVAAALACSDAVPGVAPGEGVYIAEHWQTARTVQGHQRHVVPEGVACTECHELTDTEIGPVVPSKCAKCHAEESRIAHGSRHAQQRFGPHATSDCTLCHAFTAELPSMAAALGAQGIIEAGDCAKCHLSQQGDTPAVQVHHTQECLSCHKPHSEQEIRSAPCSDCHHDITTSHAARGKDLVDVCATCHQHQHGPAHLARTGCISCHQESHPRKFERALFQEGHTECVGCHRPHDFQKQSAVECRSCHEHLLVLGGPRLGAHNQCTNCHDAHDVRAASARSCAGCHQDIHPNHPKHGKAGTCTGCHDPHPASSGALRLVRNCTTCHQAAGHEKEFHQGVGCRECHQPHDFLLAPRGVQLCADCHAENTQKTATLQGHQQCADCHRGLPHRPEALQASCGSCHAAERTQASVGHQECKSCHEPHGGDVLTACASCHKDEHRTAPQGHQACATCHQPHSGSTAAKGCQSCHAAEAKTPHGKLSATCGDCHRPHGPGGTPKPPACSTCHQKAELGGLHTLRQHQDCARCHTGHAEPTQTPRERCLDCHREQRAGHFPQAPTCASCHLFEDATK